MSEVIAKPEDVTITEQQQEFLERFDLPTTALEDCKPFSDTP